MARAATLALGGIAAAAGLLWWFAAEPAREARFAAEGVRRHEGRLDGQEKRLGEVEKRIEVHEARLDAQRDAIGQAAATADAARTDAGKVERQLDELRGEMTLRDQEMRRLEDRIERLERAIARKAGP